jgi:Flp pilus assembly protein TadG
LSSHRRSSRLHGDQGATVAEFALILPFLAILVFGVIDYGNAYRQENILEVGVMSAARANSQMALSTHADYESLQSIAGTINNMKGVTLTKVIVWKANTANTPPAACLGRQFSAADLTVKGEPDSCNVYSPAQVNATSELTGFGRSLGAGTCRSVNWDWNWCPMSRVNDERIGGDHLGVYIEVVYQPLTRFVMQNGVTMSEQVIYRLEPPYFGS